MKRSIKLFMIFFTLLALEIPVTLVAAIAYNVKTEAECTKRGRSGNNWGSSWENGVCEVW